MTGLSSTRYAHECGHTGSISEILGRLNPTFSHQFQYGGGKLLDESDRLFSSFAGTKMLLVC